MAGVDVVGTCFSGNSQLEIYSSCLFALGVSLVSQSSNSSFVKTIALIGAWQWNFYVKDRPTVRRTHSEGSLQISRYQFVMYVWVSLWFARWSVCHNFLKEWKVSPPTLQRSNLFCRYICYFMIWRFLKCFNNLPS